jgi:hypothetical protein
LGEVGAGERAEVKAERGSESKICDRESLVKEEGEGKA